jgi:hypothetical protein
MTNNANTASNVTITSEGTSIGTKILVDGVEMKGVLSVNIEEMDADSGQVVAIIKLTGVSLGKKCD